MSLKQLVELSLRLVAAHARHKPANTHNTTDVVSWQWLWW
jgi:hypothetical protein